MVLTRRPLTSLLGDQLDSVVSMPEICSGRLLELIGMFKK